MIQLIVLILTLLIGSLAEAQTVTWTNDRDSQSGTATGTATWSASIPLRPGVNNIGITGTDASGNKGNASMSVIYAPTFPGNTLAGAWDFENVGTDSSSKGNTATLRNGATYATGKFGQALSLDGINDDALVSDNNTLDFTQSFTFSAWVFPTAVNTYWSTVIIKNYQIGLYATSTGVCGDGSPTIWFKTNGNLPEFTACHPSPLPLNEWSFLAGTYNGPDVGTLTLYVFSRGVMSTVTTPASGYIEDTSLPLQIGNSQINEIFAGRIDSARVYNWAIPLSAGGNDTPAVACQSATAAVNSPSIYGDMNCPITALTPPAVFKVSASGTFKVGASGGTFKLGEVPP